MRLPLRHPPAPESALARCAYLEALAEALVGVPLGSAASLLTDARGRGRHGNALQWHLGLDIHDGLPRLDWEDRVEIKLVSVWSRADGSFACDKLKVCDAGISPWHKLSNVLWVFADRLSRVVLGTRFFCLSGPTHRSLAEAWELDPHFDHPRIFVEARETREGSAPAYYLAARWFDETGILPQNPARLGFPFDGKTWGELRRTHAGRDPLLSVLGPHELDVRCGRCGSTLQADVARVRAQGWARATHHMPLAGSCALRGHLVLDARRLPQPRECGVEEMIAGIEARTTREQLWRLADRVAEPEDHLH